MWLQRTTFGYDNAGRRTVKKLANGSRTSFSYDLANRLTTVAQLKSDASRPKPHAPRRNCDR